MNQLFVDTSAWDALADKGDHYHLNAIRFRDEIAGRCKLVTSNYVLDELFTLLLLNIGYSPTVAYKETLDFLIAEHVLDVIWIDDVIAKEAWDAFEKFNVDKQWSFTDCTSYRGSRNEFCKGRDLAKNSSVRRSSEKYSHG